MTLREAVQAVYDRHGRLSPALVLEAARGEDEVARCLHPRFEWDDGVAGEAHRLSQAGNLIRRQRIIFRAADEDEGHELRAYVSVVAPAGRSYEPTDKVAADPLLAQLALQEMEREWRALRAKWSHHAAFFELIQAELEPVGG